MPHPDEANLISCGSSVSSSSTSITTSPSELTNKPPRSPNHDEKSNMPLIPLMTTTMTVSLPRAQSTDSGTSFQKPTTTATTVNSPPPPLRHRCFSTDSNLSTSLSTICSSYDSPPPLAPPGERRRAYSSDSDGYQSRSMSSLSSSTSLQGRRLGRRESKSRRRSSLGSTSSSNSHMSTTERFGTSINSSGAATVAGPSDLQTLETELQKSMLLYGKRDVSVGKLWNAIGNSHFRNGNHRAAIQAYKQAGNCDPGPHMATANLNLGTVYWNLLKVDKSIKYLQQALAAFEYEQTGAGKKAPEAASLDVASCHHQLGLAYSLQHRFDEAVSAMETACRMRATLLGTNDPTTARTLDALGRIHLMRGDFHQALACHEQALYALRLVHFPATSTLENIAAVHMRRGDFSAAIHVYVQVVYMHKSKWQQDSLITPSSSAAAPQSNSGSAEQYYESLQQLAMAYDHVGETKYADHCRQEGAAVLEQLGSQNAGKIKRSSSF